jgi:hypothetical protein
MKNYYTVCSRIFKFILFNLLVFGFVFESISQKKVPIPYRTVDYSSESTSGSENEKNIPNDNYVSSDWEGEGPFASFTSNDEMVSRRNQKSKTFKNADGSLTLAAGLGSIHYKDNGYWLNIDTRITQNNSGMFLQYPYASTKNAFKSFYSPSEGFLVELDEGVIKGAKDKKIGWFNTNTGSFVGNTISQNNSPNTITDEFNINFENVFPNADYQISQGRDIIECDLILKNANAIPSVAPNATHFALSETFEIPAGWSVSISDVIDNPAVQQSGVQYIDFKDQYGEVIATYETPMFYEKNANPNSNFISDLDEPSKKYRNSSINGSYIVDQNGNSVTIYVLVDKDWLTHQDRFFPLVIDPSLSFYAKSGTYTSAYAWSQTGSWTGGTSQLHYDYDYSCSSDDFLYTSFDVSAISNATAVTYGYLRMYRYSGTSNQSSMYLRHINNLASSQTYGRTSSSNNGTVYSSALCLTGNNVSNSTNMSTSYGYKYCYFNSAGYANIVSNYTNGWLSYGLYSAINGDVYFYGSGHSLTPYLYITYTQAVLAGDNCTNAQDLNSLNSPYSSSTQYYTSDWLSCGTGYSGGPDRLFYMDVAVGATLTINQTTNAFDSKHKFAYGLPCPGANEIICTDDPDTKVETWTNNTGAIQRVYYLLDAYTTGSGTFTLQWTYTGTPTWTGTGDPSNWNDPNNWSTGAAPGASDPVVFPSVPIGLPPTLAIGGSCNTMTIEVGATVNIDGATVNANSVTCTGNVNVNGGKPYVSGDAAFSRGVSIGAGEIEVDGASTIGSGYTLTIASGLYDANGSFTASGATIDFTSGSSGALSLAGSVTSLGALDVAMGEVIYDGGTSFLPDVYHDLTITSSNARTASSHLTANGNFILSNGTLTIGTYTMYVGGSSDINSTLSISSGTYDANGNFDATGANLTFTGAGTLKLGSTITSSTTSLGTLTTSAGTVWYDGGAVTVVSDTYYNLKTSNVGTKSTSGNITVNGDHTIVGGSTFSVDDNTITVAGTSDINGTLISDGGTYNADGTFDATGGSVTHSGQSDKLILSGPVTSLGTFTPAQGTVEYDGGPLDSPIAITEADLGNTDWFEIQNVSNSTVDVTGWRVVVSSSYTSFSSANTTEKVLSGNMAAGALQYWSDNSTDNYWGNNLYWHGAVGNFKGWIAILDNSNALKDFVCWNWASASVTSISTSVGSISIGSEWSGDGFTATNVIEPYSLSGNDQNSLSGWAGTPATKNITNPGLNIGLAGSEVIADTYYNLEIDGAIGSPSGAVDVNGNLTVNASKSLDMSTYALNVAGDITNNGTLTLTGNTTTFDGSSSQTISGSSSNIFGGLTMNASGLILASPITVNGLLTLTSGDISSQTDISNNGSQNFAATNVLSLGSSASVSGGSASSHVIGAMRRSSAATSELSFPVGNGTNYRPCFLTPSTSTATTYTVEYSNSAHSSISYDGNGFNNTPCNTGVNHVAMGCWWDIEKSSNGSPAYLAINWDANSGVDTPADILLTHWNSGTSKWDKLNANACTSGNGSGNATASDGRIKTSSPQSDFSPFNLGSGSANNALPIDLLSFHTICSHDVVDVDFSVVSQVNNDYFLVERSVDAMEWEVIGQIEGAGNSNTQMDYTFVDANPLSNLSYYRLTQVDYDGNSKTFYPVSTTCSGSEGGLPIDVYPNPALNEVTLEMDLANYQGDDVYYTLTDATGKAVMSDYVRLDRGFNKQTLDISKLPNGVYILRFNQTKDHIKETRIVKR